MAGKAIGAIECPPLMNTGFPTLRGESKKTEPGDGYPGGVDVAVCLTPL